VVVVSTLGSGIALGTYFDVPGAITRDRSSTGQVRISEILYQDVTGEESLDFVEIENTGTREVSVTNWCLDGFGFCFTDETLLAPGSHVVVRGSQAGGTLKDSGETLELKDGLGTVVDTVTYSDAAPWPDSANGNGHSLHRRPAAPPGSPGSTTIAVAAAATDEWIADLPSPGRAYSPEFRLELNASAQVVISEVHYHPASDNPAEEFIELVNVGTAQVALDDWCIPEANRCFGAGDALAPGGVLVVPMPDAGTQLDNGRGVLRLLDAGKIVHDIVHYRDNDRWPALADGHGSSLHRRNGRLSGVEPGNWEAREPSPGDHGPPEPGTYLPMFDEVVATRSPSSTQPIEVRATLRDGSTPQLQYKVDFAPDVVVPMERTARGDWIARVPPQPEGALVRYRLLAGSPGAQGSWPRPGDGMVYRGTVVASRAQSQLPRLQWFVEDDYYQQIFNDSGLFGDNGYPTVLAFDGEVFDGAKIRVRGNQSRRNDKKKWKVVLPPGHETTLGGLLSHPVNEFALNSAFTDKSFVREILTSELQQLGGGPGQQVFPLRMERNGRFFGLYLYQEQPDGRWRGKHGFSDAAVAFKADRQATLRSGHLALPDTEMRQRYQRQTQEWLEHVDELRELIRQVNNTNQEELLDFVHASLDVPQIIEAIATMRVAQHLEWEHKNHMLLFDPADGKWRLLPIDFDLNFGRQWEGGCNSQCDAVSATAYMEYMAGNRLGRLFLQIPELRGMLDRRTKTLADAFLAEGVLEKRIGELEALLRDDAVLDRQAWGTYGQRQTMQQAQKLLIDNYVVPKRALLTGPASPRLPGPQSPTISYTMTGDTEVTITNTDSTTIDLSGIDVPSLQGKIPAGTVLRPGQSAVLTNERAPHTGDARTMRIWVPAR
jgi:spore coat protein CotH